MYSFTLRRLGTAVLTVLLMSFIIFAALYAVEGDPVTLMTQGAPISAAEREAIAEQFGLDKPFLVRYGEWMAGAATGDFGYSVAQRQDVGYLLAPRVETTALLVVMSSFWVVVVGIGAGVLSGIKRGRVDRVLTTSATVGIALPAFVTSVVLIAVFAVQLAWFPSQGAGAGFDDRLFHLFLPSIALAVGTIGFVSRTTRSAVRAEAGREYVEAALGRGISRATTVRRHVLRNAVGPIATVVGIGLGSLIVQTVIVESAFGMNGLGSLLVQSVLRKDFAVVQAISLILVISVVGLNTLVDLLCRVVDPRLGRGVSAR